MWIALKSKKEEREDRIRKLKDRTVKITQSKKQMRKN